MTKHTIALGLTDVKPESGNAVRLVGLRDSSLGNAEERRSVSGFVVYLSGRPIMFKTMMQKETALSTAESEIIGLSHLTANTLWITHLLRFLKIKVLDVKVLCDNMAAVKLFLGQAIRSD